MGRTLPLIAATTLLSGCASVTAVQLNSTTMNEKTGAPDGLVYYLPAPYLLVARLPQAVGSDDTAGTSPADAAVAVAAPAQKAQPGAAKSKKDKSVAAAPHGSPATQNPPDAVADPNAVAPTGLAGTPPSAKTAGATTTGGDAQTAVSSSSTGFVAANASYVARIVYLPDHSHPMSLRAKAGIGSTTFKPVLQDGWMLTSLDATVDSKVAENITALGSVAASVVKAMAPGGDPATTKGVFVMVKVDNRDVLHPGLYRFDYGTDGAVSGLTAVALFDASGVMGPVNSVAPGGAAGSGGAGAGR